eukprot:scpid20189/ scgid2288/ Calcium-activated potassium channel slowpoke; BK channel; Maxi K channel
MAFSFLALARELDSYRLYLQSLHSIRIGRYYDVAVAILYIAFCSVYIVNTAYLENSPSAMDTLELVLAVFFLCCWLLELFAASSRLRYLITARSFFTILATVPVLATISDQNSYVGGGTVFPYIYPSRFIACYVMVASCLVRGDESLLHITQLKLSITRLLLAIVFLILTTAAFIQIIVIKSNQVQTLNFFESFFYTVIVLFTVGYVDDVLPSSVFARTVILVAIMFGAVYIPAKVADIYQLVQEQSAFSGHFSGFSKEELRDGYSHVVVCGVWRSAHLCNFVRRLLALGGGKEMARAKVVVLGKAEPDEVLLNLLHDPLYLQRVVYVKGSVLHVPDCRRACLNKARAVFILSDNHKAAPNKMDAEVIMRAVAIHHYDPMSRILVKLQMPQNLFHLTWGGVEQVVCVDELKMGLLAQSCLCPGFSTLLYTIGCPYIGSTGYHADQREKEFVYGADQELYVENPPDHFIGRSFTSLSSEIFRSYSAILLAVATPNVDSAQGRLDLMINPRNYKFTGDEQLILLARSSDIATAISRSTPRASAQRRGTPLAATVANTSDDERTPLIIPQPTNGIQGSTVVDGRSHRLRAPNNHQSTGRNPQLSRQASIPLTTTGAQQVATAVCDPIMNGQSRSFIKHLVGTGSTPAHVSHGRRRSEEHTSSDEADGGIHMSWEYVCSGKPRHIDLAERPWSLKDHVILCDNSDGFPRNIGFFLAPLRAQHLANHMPVVVLNPSLPSSDQWKMLSSFREVYFIQGSPLEAGDLKRAAIATASYAVMVSDNTIDSLEDPENTVDAISLLAAHNFHSLARPNCFTINEVIQNSNMDLLIPERSVYHRTDCPEYAKEELSLPFMSGHAFSSSMLDNLLCSAHTNPLLLSFIRTLLFSGCLDTDDDTGEESTVAAGGRQVPQSTSAVSASSDNTVNISGANAQQDGRPSSQAQRLHPNMALKTMSQHAQEESGSEPEDVVCSVLPDRVVDPHELFEESPIYQHHQLHSLPKVHLNLKDANGIMQIPIPTDLVGSAYGNLFQRCLCDQASILIGLWRLSPDGLHYVATNPRPETVLRETDFAFVLRASGS